MEQRPDTDALTRAATAGDAQAFVQLVEIQRKQLWAVCYRITGNRLDAEDALQDALVAAWRGIGSFRGDAKFSTWLYRIASNAAIAQSKKASSDEDLDGYDMSSNLDIAGQVTSSDRIHDALQLLPEAYRVTFVLRAYGDLSYQEIADHLAVPIQTVRSRLSRAKSALQESLYDLQFDERAESG
ncbi:RNA polymerase subunit sigma [Gordonia alkanivorans]|uniref:RNA polymerase sigma factor n=1 Tax=Gordonia alkanivorans TaxID=84096 RepID=UPI000FDF1912|nr:RNA polymerase sigma factor [Gordonia alkanivorans]AZZ83503.1 RNA polymerase subunit sigma [Gordonia alkanivorans]